MKEIIASDKIRNIVLETAVSLLVLLFMYASVSKLLDFDKFRVQLTESPFLTGYSYLISWVFPVSEIILAILLIVKRTRRIGLYLSLYVMSLLSAYVYSILTLSFIIPCNCGGIISKMTWSQHLWFNLTFMAIAAIAILLQRSGADNNVVTS